MSDTHHAPVPRPMSRRTGLTINVLIFAAPAILLTYIGWRIGNHNTALGFLVVWIAAFFDRTFVVIEGMAFMVITRFGRYWTVRFGGWHLMFWEVDTIYFVGDMTPRSIELYLDANGEREDIDFKDGSAPLNAIAWWQIVDPEALSRWDLQRMREQVVRYVYRTEERARRTLIKNVFESVLRSFLEANALDEVQQKATDLVNSAVPVIKGILSEIGAFPAYATSITLTGLKLTAEQRSIRMAPLRGRMRAEEAIHGAPAYFKPLIAMIERCREAGIDLNLNDAFNAFFKQKVIEVLPHLQGSFSMVGANLDQIIGMIPLGHTASGPTRSAL